MSNPSVKKLAEKTVVKIATNVTSGIIAKHWNKSRDYGYIITTRITGQDAPTAATIISEGQKMFETSDQVEIKSGSAIDVYVYCNNGDSDTSDHGYLVVTV